MREFDYIIIGQGIAGSTLAWQLNWLGKSVAIVDRDEAATASKIASGLISPITGQRNAVSWRFEDFWPVAKSFYKRIETQTDQRVLRCEPMLKVIGDDSQFDSPQLHTYRGEQQPLSEPLNPKLDAVEFFPAAKLDVPRYLATTREFFEQLGGYVVGNVNPSRDIEVQTDHVALSNLGVFADRVIFCQGISAMDNPLLPGVEFEPTKGEILTISAPDLATQAPRVIHGQVWMAPVGNGLFQVGATYEHAFDNAGPTESGREEIIQRLSEFGPKKFELVDHRAAIRPVVVGRQPIAGQNIDQPRICHVNGLGSKGSLHAPLVCQQLAEFLVNGQQIDPDFWMYQLNERPNPKRLTLTAHEYVSEVLQSGDVAIDATAGNGYDTLFLSQGVGETGVVFAIDKQREAVERTRARLEASHVTNVRLVEGSHARLTELITDDFHGRVSAIMFNLGYLPRGDKEITTTPDTTRSAIQQGLELLKPGGIMSVLAYTGHPGGPEEASVVADVLRTLSEGRFLVMEPTPSPREDAPRLFVVKKRS